MTSILIQQVLIMFLLSLIGYFMFRFGKISLEGSKALGNILIYLSLPCVIINGFQQECTREKIAGLFLSSVFALLTLLLSIVISRIFFHTNAIEAFSGAFSNPGFFGIPLITASLTNDTVFYIAPFIAFLNLLQWSYGVSLMTADADKKAESDTLFSRVLFQLKKLMKAPFMIAILIGLFFFFTEMALPSPIGKCIGYIANLNTPLAMFTIGIYLAQTAPAAMLRKPRLYLVTLVRMIIIPLATLALLSLLPDTCLELKFALLISSACPVGSNVAVYAQLHNNDYVYAVENVVVSTFFSLVTIPGIVMLANIFWMK